MNRKRNAETVRHRSIFVTEFGCGAVLAGDEGVVEVLLPFAGESEDEITARIALLYPRAATENSVTREAASLLRKYFAGERVAFSVPVDRRCFTPFQAEVYEAVARIPYGTVRSYGEIAAQVGRPGSARGVGGAMARNPLPIIIPCHRVVGASGAMTGYSAPGGVMSKRWLLRMEGAPVQD